MNMIGIFANQMLMMQSYWLFRMTPFLMIAGK